MKIVAIYSGKGGVGKTATAVNLSSVCSEKEARVLLCDMDPQGAASYYFRVKAKKKFSSRKLLTGKFDKYIKGTEFPDLDVLPAHYSFRNLDLALAGISSRNRRKALLNVFAPLTSSYDYLFLDCPPNLTLLAENIIAAADIVVSPVIPTTLSLRSLKQLLKMVGKCKVDRKKIRPFFSMVEKRKLMHSSFVDKYKNHSIFLRTQIPFMAEIEKMGLYRRPVGIDSRLSKARRLYRELWAEISI